MTVTHSLWPPLNVTLPTGLTWSGAVDGRSWLLTGAGLTVEYPPSPRAALAAAFTAGLGDGVQVYSSPPNTVAVPAIVIKPADPYQAPGTGGGGMSAAWAFEVDIILSMAWKEFDGLAALERARETLTALLPAGWRWVEFGDVGEVLINKKPHLKATLGVAVIATEGMV